MKNKRILKIVTISAIFLLCSLIFAEAVVDVHTSKHTGKLISVTKQSNGK